MRPDYSLIARMIASTLCQTGAEFPCPYVRGRTARFSGFDCDRPLPEGLYDSLMQVNFRRNGSVVYRPDCRNCSECRMIRIPVDGFQANRAQERCRRRNLDVEITIEAAAPTDEKHALYERYLLERHSSEAPDDDAMDGSREEFESFLYTSCVNTEDLVFRDGAGKLLAVSVVDFEPRSLSAVYCYYDPVESARRSLGVFNILTLVEEARRRRLDYVYLGYWLGASRKMSYKAAFKPAEIWSPVMGFTPAREVLSPKTAGADSETGAGIRGPTVGGARPSQDTSNQRRRHAHTIPSTRPDLGARRLGSRRRDHGSHRERGQGRGRRHGSRDPL